MHRSIVRRWRWILIGALLIACVTAGCGETRVIENRTATLALIPGGP